MIKMTSIWHSIKNEPIIWASLLSLLISLFMSHDFFINNDGIYYLKGAEALLHHGTESTHPSLVWPFYPILIAGLSYFTFLPVEYSALIWQALFQIILIISFINIIRLLGGNKTIQALAGLTLLLNPELVDYRNFIIRDFGYWAFLLASFYYFLDYCKNPSWLKAGLWFVTIVIATLFRIEGVVILGLTPLLCFLSPKQSWKIRLWNGVRLYTFGFIIISALCLFLLLSAKDISMLGRLADLLGWWNDLTHNIASQWRDLLKKQSLPLWQVHEDSLHIFLLGGFLSYFIYELIKVINPLFFGIVLYGQWHHCLEKFAGSLEKRLVLGFLAINLFIPLVFLSSRWFVRGRFLMPASLILLLWVPFTLYALYQRWHQHPFVKRHYRALKILLGVLLLSLLIDCMFKFNSPGALIKESAHWIETHTPEDATLYSNNYPLSYYAHRPGPNFNANPSAPFLEEALTNNQWKKYDYLALFIKRKNKTSEALIEGSIPYPPIKRFENKRGYQIWIYEVKK